MSYSYFYDYLKQKGNCPNGTNTISLLPLDNIWTGDLNTFNDIQTKNITIDNPNSIIFSDSVKIMDGSNNVITTDGAGETTISNVVKMPYLSSAITPNIVYYNTTNGGELTYGPSLESIYYNDNSNNKIVLSASVVGQKMTVINNGVEPTFDWSQVGSPISYPIQIFKQMSDTNIWIAYNTSPTTAEIQIFDSTNTTLLGQINFSGVLDGICQIKVLAEDPVLDYVYIGGEFRTVNGNVQNQFCITRVVRSTFVEDVLFDSTTTNYGVDGTVFTLLQLNTDLYAGGEFGKLEPTLTVAESLIKIGQCSGVSGTQTYSQVGGGIDTAITKFSGYIDGLGNPILFIAGNISAVDIANTPLPTSNIATYDISNNIWTTTSGTVSFDNYIADLIPNTIPTTHFICVGQFTERILAISVDLSTTTPISGISPIQPFNLNSITFQNPARAFAIDFFYELDPINFTGVQKAYTTITPTTQIMCSTDNINGNTAISWFNQSEIYEYIPNTPPQNCIFTTNPAGYFVYGNVNNYNTYELTTKYTATYFTANEINGTLYWTPLGTPNGTFT